MGNPKSAAACVALSFSLSGLLVPLAVAETRTWKDASGKFSVEAELVEVADGKAKLRKAGGKVISVPVSRLSEADQAFLEGGGPGWKVGDQAYLQVKGQWRLGKVAEVKQSSAGVRLMMKLVDGERRTVRAVPERLRPYGKAGDRGLLLPGDVVEHVERWAGKETIKQGVIVRVERSRAYVRFEGSVGEESVWLKELHVPGSGGAGSGGASLEGRVASAEESNRKPGQKKHPSDGLTYPDPEVLGPNFLNATPIDFQASGAPASLRFSRSPRKFDAGGMRRFPVKLIPKVDDFWDKFKAAEVSSEGVLGAILRVTAKKQHQLELAPLRKTRSGSKLFGLPPETNTVAPSPGGSYVLTRRSETWGRDPKIDVWRVVWEDEERRTITGLESACSWSPLNPEDDSDALTVARWLDEERLLTLDDGGRLVVWEADTGDALRQAKLASSSEAAMVEGSDLLAINQPGDGVVLFDLIKLEVAAVIGAGKTLPGKPTFSPSGRLMVIDGSRGGFQVWDVAAGTELVDAVMVLGGQDRLVNNIAWSDEESLLLVDNRPVDVTSWKVLPGGRRQKRSYVGVAWSVAAPRGGLPSLVGEPQPAPVADEDLQPNSSPSYAFTTGSAVALDIKTDRSIADDARRRYEKMLTAQGFTIDDTAGARLTVTTKSETKRQEYGNRPFARKGDTGNFSVSYQVRSYSAKLMFKGIQLVSAGNGQSPNVPTMFTSEEEVRAAAKQRMEWDAELLPTIKLPRRVLVLSE